MQMFALALAFVAPLVPPPPNPLSVADARVGNVAWRLQSANGPLCSRLEPLTGLSLHTLDLYPSARRGEVAQLYGLGELPQVTAVAAGSPAAAAGLRAGDSIMALNGAPVPHADLKRWNYETVRLTQLAFARALANGPVRVLVADGRTLTMPAVTGCASQVVLTPGSGLNASADGTQVEIGGKLYEFAQNDDELAAAIAHELAHNILGHRERLDAANVSRGLFAGLGRNGARLRDAELEADRLAVWLIARAGYDVNAIAPFWTRLAKRLGTPLDGTHPGWRRRLALIEAEVAAVAAARAAGQPLVPPWQAAKAR